RQELRVAAITQALRRAAARNPRALNAAIPPAAGGCAFVMSAHERPGRPWRKPVRVLGSMQAAIPSASRHLVAWLASRREGVLRAAARRLYPEARLRPADLPAPPLYPAPG